MQAVDDNRDRKIDNIYSEIRKLGESVVELKTICQMQVETQADLVVKINRVERDMHQAKGAIALIKYIGAIAGSSILGLFVWIVTSTNDVTGDMREIKAHRQFLERNIDDVYKDLGAMRQQLEELKGNQRSKNDAKDSLAVQR